MIYVTGDMHGDLERFKTKEIRRLKKGDTLIVCGDFGFVWDGSERERKTLQWIGKRRFTTLFVEGTHDNLDLLAAYPEQEYQGGRVHAISGNLYHLYRGSLFTIEGKRIFAFGGGGQIDRFVHEAVKFREGFRGFPAHTDVIPAILDDRIDERGDPLGFGPAKGVLDRPGDVVV